jgi:hypothetical protein
VIYLGELACCVPLYDPIGLIAQLKAEIESYPEALKCRIIRDCLWNVQFTLFLARDFADRADIINSVGCMTRIVDNFTPGGAQGGEEGTQRRTDLAGLAAGRELLRHSRMRIVNLYRVGGHPG